MVSTKTTKKTKASIHLEGLEHLVKRALEIKASDIHIEPNEQIVKVRYRVGGLLRIGTKLPITTMNGLVVASKKLANLDYLETNKPQEGNFKYRYNDEDHIVRVQTMPLMNGEKIVLHIHTNIPNYPSLESLGYWGENLEQIHNSLAKMRGMNILASNGRNTNSMTLFSIANLLNHPPIKLGIIEDPISYKIEHAIHLEVSPIGVPYIQELNALDKDGVNVILLGNLPNQKIATTALRYSKNKMVFAGMNSISAASALHQLLRMDVDQEVVLARIGIIAGQTIVKKICAECAQEIVLDTKQKMELSNLIGNFEEEQVLSLAIQAERSELRNPRMNTLSKNKSIKNAWVANHRGCEHCGYTGYKNHILLTEVFNLDNPKTKGRFSLTSTRRSTINNIALESGMIPQIIDGVIKSMLGLVDFNDLLTINKVI